jgi:hypothetical protein
VFIEIILFPEVQKIIKLKYENKGGKTASFPE